MEGIISQFVQQWCEIQFIRSSTGGDQLIEQVVYGTAFGKTLIEKIRERLGGGHLFFPGVTPDLMIQIQAPAGTDTWSVTSFREATDGAGARIP